MSLVKPFIVVLALLLGACGPAEPLPVTAPPTNTNPPQRAAYYLGNAGVMVVDQQTKLLFDPLFGEGYNTYQLVPKPILTAIIAGTAPYDGIDVVFISHAHGDHFSAKPVLAYLQANPAVKLVAPQQAVDKLLAAGMSAQAIASRVIPINQQTGDAPISVQAGSIQVEAITIPHSGGERFKAVRNTVYRVEMAENLRVLHLGDATIENAPFAGQQAFWDRQNNDLVFTPYWLFKDAARRKNLDAHVRPIRAIGVHVPTALSNLKKRYGTALDDVDLFTRPGEVRDLQAAK
ncbi:hypothetical protein MNBD_ALPHA06-453 [hydrothermal vent metagenome]|uniref:Metallo-beta-lactamase domain-containing protein n=1 Tax=hydrothermal vent metagenome TaxID=652676 RepID=A0A3B0RHH7_9ZZZZ